MERHAICAICKAKKIPTSYVYCPFCGSKLLHFETVDWESIKDKPFKILLHDLNHCIALMRKLGFNIEEINGQFWIKVNYHIEKQKEECPGCGKKTIDMSEDEPMCNLCGWAQ